jgi:hypothetical protein
MPAMAAARTPRLAAAWEGRDGYQVGVLAQRGARWP